MFDKVLSLLGAVVVTVLVLDLLIWPAPGTSPARWWYILAVGSAGVLLCWGSIVRHGLAPMRTSIATWKLLAATAVGCVVMVGVGAML